MERKIGRLLLIGGNEDKNEDSMVILPHFVKMCGGRDARIIVCGTPSEKVEEKERTYRDLFEKIGVAEVMQPDITIRHDGGEQELVDMVKRATGVFFTGGDQLRITSQVGDSPVFRCLQELHEKGATIAGTSAGAAAMSETMLIGGAGDESNRISTLGMAPGLGLMHDVVFDSHFAERGRFGRLLGAVAQNPRNLGIGIDEDTAIVVDGTIFEVLGSGAVYIVDGHDVSHSNVAEAKPERVLSMFDVRLHVLSPGDGFDLAKRRPSEAGS